MTTVRTDPLDPSPQPIRPRDRLFGALSYAPNALTWRVTSLTFVIAGFAHLWLADAWQLDWLPANVMLAMGIGLIAWRPAAPGFLLCIPGLLLPLLFHRDVLTQSVLLLFLAASAAGWLLWAGWRTPPGPQQPPRAALPAILRSWQLVTVATYALATLHKLNADFMDTRYSCAVYGWDKLLDYWSLPADLAPETIFFTFPYAILAVEASIAILHMTGKRWFAWPIAVAFHIPLTLTMAPAFALVMLAGHAAFLTEEDISQLRATLARRGVVLATIGAALTAASLFAHGSWPEHTMVIKEWLLWSLLLTLLITRAPTQHAAPTVTSRAARALPVMTGLLFFVHGLMPYSGLQFQHTGAMLSNLRIDRGCWNSLVFSEHARVTDDYIRVNATHFVEPGHNPEYEAIVRAGLWSPPQLRQMQRNWCRPHSRPFYLEGTWRQAPFVIEDLCALAPDELPFHGAGVFGVELFPDYIRFQKNLSRECPQACMH